MTISSSTTFPPEGRVLAVDPGSKRLGLAISDPGRVVAQPLVTLRRRGDRIDAAAIAAVAGERDAVAIVVGLPLRLDGSRGPAYEFAARFLERVREATSLPVVGWDERLTTVQAERLLVAAGVRRERRRQGATDRIAAALILESFLGTPRSGGGGGPG